jgi:hypothetical protein
MGATIKQVPPFNKHMKRKQTRDWHLVIMKETENGTIDIKELEKAINIYCSYYFIILHEKDTNEHGEVKKPHFHIVMKTRKRITLGGLLRDLSELLKIDKTVISARETINEIASIRYLLHLDYQDKHQYAPYEILTKRHDILKTALDGKEIAQELTAQLLIEIIKENKNKLKIMEKIGLNNYQKYRGAIIDIINQLQNDQFLLSMEQKIKLIKKDAKAERERIKALKEYEIKKQKQEIENTKNATIKGIRKEINEVAIEVLRAKKGRK